jgi:hypothetical protein
MCAFGTKDWTSKNPIKLENSARLLPRECLVEPVFLNVMAELLKTCCNK